MARFSQIVSWVIPVGPAIATGLLLSAAMPRSAAATTPFLQPDPPAFAPAAPAAPALDSGYRLGPGDQIEITVFGYEEYTGPQVILPDGTFTLPLLGQVQAAGKTLPQLTTDLTAQLNGLVVEPAVTIEMTSLRPLVVTVAGEVQRPGPVQLRSLTAAATASGGTPDAALEAAPTLSSALMEAGGVTSQADIRQIRVRRSHAGEDAVVTFNLWDAIWSENVPQDPILQDGDAIFVPRVVEGDPLDQRLLARSSLSPETIQVRVVGEVTLPGEVNVSPDSTLSSAIATAGGPTTDANLRRVELVRLNENGTIDRQRIDLRNLVDNVQVQDGDVLFVPKGTTFTVLDFAGRILNPLTSLINLINRF